MDVDVMDLLAEHVPITLLADLAQGGPVSSRAILRAEQGEAAWMPPRRPEPTGPEE